VQIENVFSGEPATGMREAAAGLIKRLAQTAKDTFGDFEDAVEKDATKTPVLDGTVHPLTSYVINYVKFLFEYVFFTASIFPMHDNCLSVASTPPFPHHCTIIDISPIPILK
jgi:exocyst complex protein 7